MSGTSKGSAYKPVYTVIYNINNSNKDRQTKHLRDNNNSTWKYSVIKESREMKNNIRQQICIKALLRAGIGFARPANVARDHFLG